MLLHKDDPVLPELRRQGEPLFVLDVNPETELHTVYASDERDKPL